MRYIAGLYFLLFSTQAFAVLDLQLFSASRGGSVELTQDDTNESFSYEGKELSAAVHLNPIESIPVAIGMSYSSQMPHLNSSSSDVMEFKNFSGSVMAVEMMAWTQVGQYAVYSKIGHVLQGQFDLEVEEELAETNGGRFTQRFNYRGKYIAVGFGIPMAKSMGFLLEYRLTVNGELNPESAEEEVGLSLMTNPKDALEGSLNASSVMAGFEISI